MNFGLHANFWFVTLGTVLCGVSAGVLGCFALLRKRALLGDAIAHAALPGVCLAYLVTGTKHLPTMILGAGATALLGSFSVNAITRHSRLKEDTAIGLVLSVFFGIGIMLLTFIQHQPMGSQSGLDKFLFGQAASLVGDDVRLFSMLAAGVLCLVALAYKELKVMTFDPEFAAGIGIRVGWCDALLTLLVVGVVTAGLQAVGIVLMAALLITPAAAARQWTDRLGVMLLLAALFGGLSGLAGAVISRLAPRMPTGPWIVVAITTCFLVSVLAAPRRGVIARAWRRRQNARRINAENILKTLYRLSEDAPLVPTTIDAIRRYRPLRPTRLLRVLRRLEHEGLVRRGAHPDQWSLTDGGRREAAHLVRRHRLWEVYLTRYVQLSAAHVHADAEEIEHILTPELERELEALLQRPSTDPHTRPIPYPPGGQP